MHTRRRGRAGLVVEGGHGGGGFDELVVVELPDDLLVAGDLERVHARAALTADPVANQQVAVLQDLDAADPGKAQRWPVLLTKLPHDLAGARHFENVLRFAASDEGVAVGEANGL